MIDSAEWSTSKIFLSKKALRKNINFFKRQFGPEVTVSSVVKGNAYGHGIEPFVEMAASCGIDHFSVFSADEAWRVWKTLNGSVELMVIGYLEDDAMEWAIENGISFWVFDNKRLEKAYSLGAKKGKPAKIHLELETGMNRTGLDKSDWPGAIKVLKKRAGFFQLEGICTHFAGAESISNYLRIHEQKKVYKQALNLFKKNGIVPKHRHTNCSAGSIRYPEMNFDLVRIGILQYGLWPSKEIFIEFLKNRKDKKSPIERVITWKSQVMSLKTVESGEFIGYGNSYFAGRKMKVAIVPVGYSSGFRRSLSNSGRMLIGGRRVGVIGIVNMNCLAVDVSEVPSVKPGDEVVLIGKQGNQEMTVSSFTELSRQLNYEALTRIPENIERIVMS